MNTAQRILKTRKAFTLIEILLVVAMISVLAVAVFVALNPAKRLIDSKNARRQSDVDTILSAIHQFVVDNRGVFPTNMPATNDETQLGTDVSGCAIATGGCAVTEAVCVDLMTGATNLSTYLKTMPIDPTTSTYDAGATGYSIVRDTNGIVTVRSCGAETPAGESTVTISASR